MIHTKRMRSMLWILGVLALTVGLISCNKEEPKAKKDAKPETEQTDKGTKKEVDPKDSTHHTGTPQDTTTTNTSNDTVTHLLPAGTWQYQAQSGFMTEDGKIVYFGEIDSNDQYKGITVTIDNEGKPDLKDFTFLQYKGYTLEGSKLTLKAQVGEKDFIWEFFVDEAKTFYLRTEEENKENIQATIKTKEEAIASKQKEIEDETDPDKKANLESEKKTLEGEKAQLEEIEKGGKVFQFNYYLLKTA